jgi:tRNA pseudouridine38-40 synthase
MDWSRTISRAELETRDDGYRITFEGNGFLYKMVRMLVGAAVHTAQGRLRMDDFSQLLDQGEGSELPHGKSPICAPADGLYLQHVIY